MKRLFPFYYFDEETLEFKRVNLRTLILLFGISLFASILIVPSIYKSSVIKIMYADFYEPESVVLNVSESKNEFSEEKLIGVLTDLNIKFPHIHRLATTFAIIDNNTKTVANAPCLSQLASHQ